MSGADNATEDRLMDPIDRPRDYSGAPPAASRPPEADPAQNNEDSTPGTGMLPPLSDEDDPNVQPSS